MFGLFRKTRKNFRPRAPKRVVFVLGILATFLVYGPAYSQVVAPVAPAAPQITNVSASEGVDNIWCFKGTVVAENAPGMVVTFGGLPSVEGLTAIVQADGGFCLIVELQPGEEGTVTGVTVDSWGQVSNTAYWIVRQT